MTTNGDTYAYTNEDFIPSDTSIYGSPDSHSGSKIGHRGGAHNINDRERRRKDNMASRSVHSASSYSPTSPVSPSSTVRGSTTSTKTASTAPLTPNLARRLQERRPSLVEVGHQLADVTNEAGRILAAGAKQGLRTFTSPMEVTRFGWFDALAAVFSVGMFYFDVVSDTLVAYYMYSDPATSGWFIPTVLLLVIPLIIVNGFSIYWYWFDEHVCEPGGMCYRSPRVTKSMWAARIIAHLFLQANLLRYIDILYYGYKSLKQESSVTSSDQETSYQSEQHKYRIHAKDNSNEYSTVSPTSSTGWTNPPTYTQLWIHAERDAANVDLLFSLVQDAPQLIMQLYIIAHTIPNLAVDGVFSQTLIMQFLAVAASLVAMSWSVGSFSRSVRLAEPSLGNLSPAGLVLLTLSHFCSIGPQVMCFALFSTKFLIEFIVLVSCHWLATSVLVLIQLICCQSATRLRATFIHDVKQGPCHRLDDIAFSASFGMVMLFTFIDVGTKLPRIQGAVYHFLRIIEEACIITFWYLSTGTDMWYHWLPLILVSTFFVLGIVFFSLYYFCTNPDRLVNARTA